MVDRSLLPLLAEVPQTEGLEHIAQRPSDILMNNYRETSINCKISITVLSYQYSTLRESELDPVKTGCVSCFLPSTEAPITSSIRVANTVSTPILTVLIIRKRKIETSKWRWKHSVEEDALVATIVTREGAPDPGKEITTGEICSYIYV